AVAVGGRLFPDPSPSVLRAAPTISAPRPGGRPLPLSTPPRRPRRPPQPSEPLKGFEPLTSPLPRVRSTTELQRRRGCGLGSGPGTSNAALTPRPSGAEAYPPPFYRQPAAGAGVAPAFPRNAPEPSHASDSA